MVPSVEDKEIERLSIPQLHSLDILPVLEFRDRYSGRSSKGHRKAGKLHKALGSRVRRRELSALPPMEDTAFS
jgi:hypothetical protein